MNNLSLVTKRMFENLKLESVIIFLYAVLLMALPFPKENVFNSILIITGCLTIIYFFKLKRNVQVNKTKYPIYLVLNGLFFLIYLLSYFLSQDKESAFVIVSKKAYFVAIPLLFYLGPKITTTVLKTILHYYVLNLFVLSILGLVKSYYLYQLHLFDNYSYDTMLTALGIHLTYYGVLVVFAIYLLLYKFFDSNSKKTKIITLVLLGFFYFFLMILATRIIIVLSVLITVIVLLKNLKLKIVVTTLLLVLIVSVSVLYVSNSYVATRFKNVFSSDVGGKTDVSSREIHWKSVINSLKTKKSFIIGNTVGDKQIKLVEEYRKNKFHGAEGNYNAHNQFLEVLVATGLLGLLIFLSIFVFMIYYAVKIRNQTLIVFQIIFIVTCITESMFERQLGIITYLTINSLLLYSFTGSTIESKQLTEV